MKLARAGISLFPRIFIALDHASRDTTTLGEAITGTLGISIAENYTGSVLVLKCNEDVEFCGTFDLPIDGQGIAARLVYLHIRKSCILKLSTPGLLTIVVIAEYV
jgi:hypothetical protein